MGGDVVHVFRYRSVSANISAGHMIPKKATVNDEIT